MKLQDKKQELIQLGSNVQQDWLTQQLDWCCQTIEANMQRYGLDFPSACATNGNYRIKPNDDWTNGFWTGMLWLAYEWTGRETISAFYIVYLPARAILLPTVCYVSNKFYKLQMF